MVEMKLSLKALSEKRSSKHDLPTPESPANRGGMNTRDGRYCEQGRAQMILEESGAN